MVNDLLRTGLDILSFQIVQIHSD